MAITKSTEGPACGPLSIAHQWAEIRAQLRKAKENFIDNQGSTLLSLRDGLYRVALAYQETRRSNPDTDKMDACVHILMTDIDMPAGKPATATDVPFRVYVLVRECSPELLRDFLRDARTLIGRIIEIRDGSIVPPQEYPSFMLR